ncbi:MAG: putative hydrolase (metallo-beta-lactamase superfamily) [uncultured archaeon A07HR60]|nr:MAG: putative hydrolase (metallo-beta-lactamase superfamily) [uncultured archaeon A07HR60]
MVLLAGCGGAVSDGSTAPETAAAQTDDPGEGGSSSSTPTPTQTPAMSTGESPANGTLEIHFINVGQSVSTLVVSPEGETMLVDTGHYNDDGEYVLEYLRSQGIDRIDYLVTSHNDADHIGGNAAIIEYYETAADGIGAVYDPGIAASTQTYSEYLDAVETHDVTLYETREGDDIGVAGVDVSVFGPPDPYLEGEARNENSIVLKLTYGQTSFLLSGDAEDDQEAYLVEQYGQRLQSTVLKAGHHGSASSSSDELLNSASPEAVIVSSGYDNRYDHPARTVLQRLGDQGGQTYWTGTHGDILLVSDGQSVSVRTQYAAPSTAMSLRDGDPARVGTTGVLTERAVLGGDETLTPTATPVTDGGTSTPAAGELSIVEIHADAAGDERTNLGDEYLVFENTGGDTLELSGWTVADEAGRTYTVPAGISLEPGETLTLHTGAGQTRVPTCIGGRLTCLEQWRRYSDCPYR